MRAYCDYLTRPPSDYLFRLDAGKLRAALEYLVDHEVEQIQVTPLDLHRLILGHRWIFIALTVEYLLITQPIGRGQQDGFVVGELLQEPELTGGRVDLHSIVLLHIILNEALQHLTRVRDAPRREMQIVYEEKHGASAIERQRGGGAGHRRAACGSDLRLFAAAAGRDAIEEGNLARFAVYSEQQLFALEAVNEIALLIEDREIRLHQFGVDPDHIVAGLLSQGWQRRRTGDDHQEHEALNELEC